MTYRPCGAISVEMSKARDPTQDTTARAMRAV